MKNLDIYNQIKNPLDDDEVMKKIGEIYENGKYIYNGLIKSYQKEYENYYSVAAKDEFYSNIYNIWKDYIVNYPEDRIDKLVNKDNFILLRNYLKQLPEIKTYDDVKTYFYNVKDKKISELLENNGPIYDNNWLHIKSRYLNLRGEANLDIKHRLYLNAEGVDIHFILNKFINKCRENNLPFYFKFDESAARDDSIVIYSDDENLCNYISILREIAKENKDVIARCKKPPILTGVIDGFIGYGSEPTHDKNGNNRSFNLVRSDAINTAIKKTMEDWLNVNRTNRKINYNGKSKSVSEYLSMKVLSKVLDDMKNKIEYQKNNSGDLKLPFTENDLNNPNFIYYVKKSLEVKMESYLDYYTGKVKECGNLNLKLRGEKEFYVWYGDFSNSIKELVGKLIKNDEEFRRIAKKNILIESNKDCIDVRKYCFDKGVYETLEKEDKFSDEVMNLYKILFNACTRYGVEVPRSRNKYESYALFRKYILNYYDKVKDVLLERKAAEIKKREDNRTNNRIIQDLPINSKEEQVFDAKGMTSEEIEAAKKLIKK